MKRIAILAVAALTLSSCSKIDHPRYGGDKEVALAKAALAGDAAAVAAQLASHADPNVMVDVNGRSQSAWYVALDQVRPDRPETVSIITAMLKAGANPNAAWGTGDAAVTRATRSMWDQFWSGSRSQSTTTRIPMSVVMRHPTVDAVRALVAAKFDPRLGGNALVDAVGTGNTEIARILIDADVDVNSHPLGTTPLVAAIETRNIPLMNYLEEHGAREKP